MFKRGLILIIPILLLVSSGCNGEITSSKSVSEMTPSEVVETYAKAHQIEDFDTMYGFMSEEIKNFKSLDEFRRSIENKLSAMSGQGVSYTFIAVLNEEINGNQATVEFEYEMQSMNGNFLNTKSLPLVKEGDGWKLISFTIEL